MTNQVPSESLSPLGHTELHEHGAIAGGLPADVLASRIQRRQTTLGLRLLEALRSFLGCLRVLLQLREREGWLGPYRVSAKIGEGGMGIVYKALHPRSAQPVAVKVLPLERRSQANRTRFEREAQVTRLLRHPNTVSVLDVGRTADGSPYYVMEYLDGVDLQTLVERDGPLPPPRVAALLAQLAGALHEVHEHGVLHGDVKPANIVCSTSAGGRDRAKLLDFGLARALPCPARARASSEGAVLGTPLYLSPEALLSPERVDARSDLYALGAVGYFLLTGVPPFSGRSILHVFTQHVHASPLSPSERLGRPVPRALEAALMSCLSKAPERRPESAAALFELLLPLVGGTQQKRAALRARPAARAGVFQWRCNGAFG